ncbi:MAG: HAD-IA family hydrolase [Pseudorhodoplanes sp.]|nr:HAD-IA family hydrolase [Pseudorhodoplanes sp.]
MMPLHAILFDVDGTLVDTEELHRRAFNQAFLEFELGWDWTPDIYAGLLKISGGAERIGHYVESLSVSPLLKSRLRRIVPTIHGEKTRIYGDLLGGHMVRLQPGVGRLIKDARAAGIRIGLAATSASDNIQPLVMAAFGPAAKSMIDVIVCADLVSKKKPAPDIYRLLLSMLGVCASDAVALEDSTNGVAAAKAAGLVTIAVASRWTQEQDLSQADLRLSSLGDPDSPLPPDERVAIGGAPFLGLAQIAEILQRSVAADGRQRAAIQ